MKCLTQCIDNDIIPQSYTDAGDIGGLTPNEQWVVDQAMTKYLIVSSIPDSIFNQIKDHATVKGMWDTMKALFKGQSQNLIIDLQQKLQQQKCEEAGNLCTHFNVLISQHK